MAILIGTAGHVDHGKTSLIKALTGIDTDRLPEEKLRGMTLDLGFASIEIEGIGPVSIVDVPGHEKYLKNMLIGALGTDLCILCIAADESVRQQTKEHLKVLQLLETNNLIVALTRCDIAEAELIEYTSLEVMELIEDTRFAGAKIIQTSAMTGLGLDELKAAIKEIVTQASPQANAPWYLPIDRVFSVKGKGTVVTGTLMRGQLKVGDSAIIQPGNIQARIREIQSHHSTLRNAEARSRVAINVATTENVEILRGMMLGPVGSIVETECLNLSFHAVENLKHGERIRMSIGADEVMGKIFLLDNSPELVQIRTENLAGATVGQPVIIRRYSPMKLLGGGTITEPQAQKLRKNSLLETNFTPSLDQTLDEQILQIIGSKPNGCFTDEICRKTARTPQELGDIFEALKSLGKLHGFAGLWLTPENLATIEVQVFAVLAKLQQEFPQVAGHTKETILKESGLDWDTKPLQRMLTLWTEEEKLVLMYAGYALADFEPQLNNRQNELLVRIVEELEKNPIEGVSPFIISKKLNIPKQAVDEMLKLGQSVGKIALLDDGLYFSRGSLKALAERLSELPKQFTVAEFRDHFETSRKFSVPILEYFDSKQITVRTGETRVIKS